MTKHYFQPFQNGSFHNLILTKTPKRHSGDLYRKRLTNDHPTTRPSFSSSCYCVQRTVAKRAGFTLLSYRSKMDTVRKELRFHYWFILFSFEITRPLRALSLPYGLSGNNNNHLQRVFLAISVFSFSRETKNTVLWQKRNHFYPQNECHLEGNSTQ